MEPIKKELLTRVRELAEEYKLDKGEAVTNFINFEANYIFRHNGYELKQISEQSQTAFNIYTRYMRIHKKINEGGD